MAIESGWLERVRTTTLYRYRMPEGCFQPQRPEDPAGHYISRATVVPLSVEPVGDLLAALAEANVELRITPRLMDLWERVIRSSMEYSGTRLRNAVGYAEANSRIEGSIRPNGPGGLSPG